MIGMIFAKSKPELVVLLGVGAKTLLAVLMLKLVDCSVMIRLGGDPLKDNISMARSSIANKRYADWLRHRVNAILAVVLLKWVDGLIVVNPALVKTLKQRVADNLNIFVVPQPCFKEVTPHQYSVKTPVELLTVANLKYPDKASGVIWLMKQLSVFVQSHSFSLTLRVAGAGQHLSDIQDYLDAAELPDGLSVLIEGHVNDLDIFYRRADAFVYHSIHDATPNVILESKSYGIPLLANDCEEFRFIVKHNDSGFLYKDDGDFQARLEQVLENEALRESLGKAAQDEFEQLFSVDAVSRVLDKTVLHHVNEGRHS
jgi:glycosyltransferase involved in cell wall biosynthesis